MAFTVIEGGGAFLSADRIDREWQAAWAEIANGCESGLGGLHPLHPRRDELLTLTRDARAAAALPAAPPLRGA